MAGGAKHTTLYADLDHLLAWYAGATPGGAWVRFAVGATLDPDHAVARQVAEWDGAGAIERRDDHDGAGLLFHLRKRGDEAAVPKVPGPRAAEMLVLLEAAARAGRPCPSYTGLAQAMGLRNRQVARHLFNQLRTNGKIHVDGEGRARRVMLTASGAVLRPDLADCSASPAAPQPGELDST